APPASWDPHWNINLNPQQGSSVFNRSAIAAPPPAAPEPPQPPIWRAETVAFPQPEAARPAQPAVAPPPPMPAPAALLSPRPITTEGPSLMLMPFVAMNRVFD